MCLCVYHLQLIPVLRVSLIQISIEMLVDGPSGGNKSNESPIVAEPSSSTSVMLNVITIIM